MKAILSLLTLLCLAGCNSFQSASDNQVDSVFVPGTMGQAEISVSILLPADQLDEYHINQMLPCKPYGTDPDRFGHAFVEDAEGTWPVIIKSLTPIK
jgi:hypothetical protein